MDRVCNGHRFHQRTSLGYYCHQYHWFKNMWHSHSPRNQFFKKRHLSMTHLPHKTWWKMTRTDPLQSLTTYEMLSYGFNAVFTAFCMDFIKCMLNRENVWGLHESPIILSDGITGLHTQKAYTHTGTSSSQILMLSAHAYMHFAWELQLDSQCVHLVYAYRSNCNKDAYMHEQITKEFGKMNIRLSRFGVRIGWRKYLYECTPFGYVNLWAIPCLVAS